MIDFAMNGAGMIDAALVLNRTWLGVFMVLAGLHKLVHARNDRFADLLRTRWHLPYPSVLRVLIPCAEATGGTALVLGFLAPLAAIGLSIILVGAFVVESELHIKPGQWHRVLSSAMSQPETLLLVMCTIVWVAGPGSAVL